LYLRCSCTWDVLLVRCLTWDMYSRKSRAHRYWRCSCTWHVLLERGFTWEIFYLWDLLEIWCTQDVIVVCTCDCLKFKIYFCTQDLLLADCLMSVLKLFSLVQTLNILLENPFVGGKIVASTCDAKIFVIIWLWVHCCDVAVWHEFSTCYLLRLLVHLCSFTLDLC